MQCICTDVRITNLKQREIRGERQTIRERENKKKEREGERERGEK